MYMHIIFQLKTALVCLFKKVVRVNIHITSSTNWKLGYLAPVKGADGSSDTAD